MQEMEKVSSQANRSAGFSAPMPVLGKQGQAVEQVPGVDQAIAKAERGSKGMVSSVMATYCMLPQKSMALMRVEYRGP